MRRAEAMSGNGAATALAALAQFAFATVAAGRAAAASVTRAASAIAAGDVTWPVVYCEHVSSRLCLVDREAGVGGSERVVAPLGGGVVLCAEEACASL
jgi:hypothetical protein